MERRGVRVSTELLAFLFLQLLGFFHVESQPLAPAMFIFGDSLIDNGNNNYLPTIARANYPPYGIDFGSPTGRFCNGLTVVDYGARLLGLPFIPANLSPSANGRRILNGLNYASAAAGILDETGRNYGGRMSFNGQILLFKRTVIFDLPPLFQTREALVDYLARSIFIINIGSNDYINNYLLSGLYSTSQMFNGGQYADLLIQTYSQQISKLYRLGARKMVLTGIGPLGCIPSQLSMVSGNKGCVARVNNLVRIFNDRLLLLSETLNASLPGTFFIYQDTYNSFFDLIKNPSQYGFNVSNQACCGSGRYGGALTCLPLQPPCPNRDQYIFWDSFHPTQAVNAIFAERCYSPNTTDCYPISISELAQV
ncbi:hypothetical protein AQUCO_00200982v1 [Aquilegia coerulea]|uniref:Uncharacterized protein n=1 Tax=Aquilegia coerulea TaxID=218851 RepID=A0A2G5F5R6_AQUCA|nr:hypothetical protein AQUCO_00200982v1 [Aquilegia coerulea]